VWCAGALFQVAALIAAADPGPIRLLVPTNPGKAALELPQHRSLTSCEILRVLTSVPTRTAKKGTHLHSSLILGAFSLEIWVPERFIS
jgi:hypothetical protein